MTPNKPKSPIRRHPPRPLGRRIRREQRTIAAMFEVFCSDQHGTVDRASGTRLCDDCAGLLGYAHQRLENCPFGEAKCVCNQCATHCYSETRRAQVKEVMRYAGPRMMRRFPVLALMHLWDKRRGG
jgi:hypothetical protein